MSFIGITKRGFHAPAEERFWRYVTIDPSGCWLWAGHKTVDGYGMFTTRSGRPDGSRGGRLTSAHRFSYLLLKAAIPAGFHVDHLCRIKNCVNPEHLEAVTQLENNRRRTAVRTHCKRGHPITEENITVTSDGKKICKPCGVAIKADYYVKVVKDRRKAKRDLAATGVI
jgi:hypothetical protein